jgi:uncharacterized membrane protein (UPF0127 family)
MFMSTGFARRAPALILAIGSILYAAGCQPNGAGTSPFGLKTVELKIVNADLNAEVADTPQTSQNGLMFRDSLPENRGMLFVFEHPKTAFFWMKNTKIPLSIAFIDSTGKILEIKSLKPLDETTVPSASDRVAFALEVNEGWFGRHGISPGAQIDGMPRR